MFLSLHKNIPCLLFTFSFSSSFVHKSFSFSGLSHFLKISTLLPCLSLFHSFSLLLLFFYFYLPLSSFKLTSILLHAHFYTFFPFLLPLPLLDISPSISLSSTCLIKSVSTFSFHTPRHFYRDKQKIQKRSYIFLINFIWWIPAKIRRFNRSS